MAKSNSKKEKQDEIAVKAEEAVKEAVGEASEVGGAAGSAEILPPGRELPH